MGFSINRNLYAFAPLNSLNKHTKGLARSIERLSTGLRINRGADDPAGLTISENLRSQITGLSRAINNAQEGISVIQTADGALSETSSLIGRMRELAVQAQADSLTSTDRLELQEEIDELVAEIDSLASSTEFNTKTLLNGNASARASTSASGITAYARGSLQSGTYDVSLSLSSAGNGEIQESAIQTLYSGGANAGTSDTLGSLASMYDTSGNSYLEDPTTLTLRANGNSAEVTITSSMTLSEFASAMESAITSSSSSGGLNVAGSTFAYDTSDSQFIFESGMAGNDGELSIAGDQDILDGLGFSVTTESSAKAFRISATQNGVSNSSSFSTNTTSDRALNLIPNLDLKFRVPEEARIAGSVQGNSAINVTPSAGDVIFTFHDTNSKDNNQDNGAVSAGVTITLTAGRAYTTTSITDMINNSIANANNTNNALTSPTTTGNFSNPGFTASFNGNDLVLTSSVTGTSGSISIAANQAATDVLGVTSGNFTGSGGTAAALTGNVDISSGATFTGVGVIRIRVGDGDYNIDNSAYLNGSTSTNITFNKGSAISSASITTAFNNYFTANSINATATVDGSGFLNLTSGETGTDSKISIASAGGSLSAIGLTTGDNNSGSGGTASILTGSTADGVQTTAFSLSQYVRFNLSDRYGNQTSTIYFGTESTTSSESFSISKEKITSIFSDNNLSSTDVDFKIDSGNRLVFQSRTAGKEARVSLSAADSTNASAGLQAFGINFSAASQGSGESSFKLHVRDTRLNFQVGANSGQNIQLDIGNSSAAALGLDGLDLTTIRSATRSIGLLDEALSKVNRDRSKAGAIQNRLDSTVSNLTSQELQLTNAESYIRDTDIAIETVDFTRSQLLLQSATAQLTQANALSDIVLSLVV